MTAKCKRGAFTLVELVMVIVIIGLLAAVVVPKFSNLRDEAQNAAEQGMVSAIKSGINTAYMTSLAQGSNAYPDVLDSAANGDASEANPLFINVIENGITDNNWEKTGARAYKFKRNGNKYNYDKTTGKFTKS